MFTKSILTAAAIALAAGLGSASAGERFATVDGLSAQPLSADELAGVRGAAHEWYIVTPGGERLFPGNPDILSSLERLPPLFQLHDDGGPK